MKELKYIKGNLLEIAEISIIGHQDKTIWNFRNINTNELFSGTQYQFCCGSTGASSGSGTVTLPYTFKNQPAIICTINSSSTTQLFSITVSNLTKSSFSYYKNFVNVSTAGPTSGGQATNESFNWIALG